MGSAENGAGWRMVSAHLAQTETFREHALAIEVADHHARTGSWSIRDIQCITLAVLIRAAERGQVRECAQAARLLTRQLRDDGGGAANDRVVSVPEGLRLVGGGDVRDGDEGDDV